MDITKEEFLQYRKVQRVWIFLIYPKYIWKSNAWEINPLW